ncbi:hypothetical protein K2173_015288 [Erythroxylum novogranatense]|uniref:Laccase n=1 Tax=Erythroxylum novogranatense TaxID=1862640 RepID=A0AAV8T2L3_9ROSI|nr:hypothetical protein K2173_015288 [Erythroxylum novogranatense]
MALKTARPLLLLAILGVVLLDGLLFCMANPHIRYYDFVLQETNFTRLCSTKSMLTVNGSFPGPTLTVHKGDTIYVNVHNQGTYGVTLHWHGVKQPRNPWSDGPENITQCPIQPGKNFTYEVIFSTEEGTLWWHAHSDWTRATVHGAIVILPSIGTNFPFPTPYAQQTIVIASWFKGSVEDIISYALATGGEPNTSNAFTINGQPGDLYPCSNGTTYHMLVEYGKTYLLRIINAVMNREQFFGIASHTLTVVGQDGAYIKPITTSYIMVAPGQTMDLLVKANQPPSYYYMASSPFSDTIVPFDNTTTTAILQYNSNCTRPPSIPFPDLPGFTDAAAARAFTSRIKSLGGGRNHPVNVPKNINQRLYITVSVNVLPCPDASCAGPNGDRLSASMNNISFATKPMSILEAYYRNLSGVFDKDFPDNPPFYFNFAGNTTSVSDYTAIGTKVKMLNYDDEVEIVFQGTNLSAAENHPMHIHGFSFYLVGTGKGNFNNVTDPKNYNLIDPPLINTVGVPKNGWAAIRFLADNPGVWFIHCHLDRHMSWGMDMVLIVRNGKTMAKRLLHPPAHMPPCS